MVRGLQRLVLPSPLSGTRDPNRQSPEGPAVQFAALSVTRRIGEWRAAVPVAASVEDFETGLDVLAFGPGEVFREAGIQIHEVGATQDAASGVAVGAERRRSEGRRVEPLQDGLVGIRCWVADYVGAITTSKNAARLVVGEVPVGIDAERKPRGDGVDAASVPAADDPVQEAGRPAG